MYINILKNWQIHQSRMNHMYTGYHNDKLPSVHVCVMPFLGNRNFLYGTLISISTCKRLKSPHMKVY